MYLNSNTSLVEIAEVEQGNWGVRCSGDTRKRRGWKKGGKEGEMKKKWLWNKWDGRRKSAFRAFDVFLLIFVPQQHDSGRHGEGFPQLDWVSGGGRCVQGKGDSYTMYKWSSLEKMELDDGLWWLVLGESCWDGYVL